MVHVRKDVWKVARQSEESRGLRGKLARSVDLTTNPRLNAECAGVRVGRPQTVPGCPP